ncbi:F-box protein, partial [Trifolium medium]|nr:F-box protein [Trifolium medium]
SDDEEEVDYSIIPYSIRSFLDNPSFTLFADNHPLFDAKDCNEIVGCNGLICLTGYSLFLAMSTTGNYKYEYWLRIWNPATREISEKIGCFIDSLGVNFNFGCDNSTGTFKVVASSTVHDHSTSNVRVLSFGDSVWRNIESFPVVPLHLDPGHHAVFLNGTLNWLAIHNYTP